MCVLLFDTLSAIAIYLIIQYHITVMYVIIEIGKDISVFSVFSCQVIIIYNHYT